MHFFHYKCIVLYCEAAYHRRGNVLKNKYCMRKWHIKCKSSKMAFDCGITHFKKQIGGKPRVWIEY